MASFAVLALAMWRGSRLGGRLASGFAGAFLEAWGDLRLEKKVAGILAKAEARADESGGREELRKLWNP